MARKPRDLAWQFREALSNLAAPGAEALAAIRDRYIPFTVHALATEYETALLQLLEVFRGGFSECQLDALFRVTELLDAMNDDCLWTEQAVRADTAWERVRSAAKAAIASLGTRQPDVVDRSLADEVNGWKWQLHQMIDAVVDPSTLLEFVRALVRDSEISMCLEAENPASAYGPRALGWENVTVNRFLDAAESWAQSTKFGETQGFSPANPWRQFAAFLYCGKIYE